MANPTADDFDRILRIVMYFRGWPGCLLWYRFQDEADRFLVYIDSDGAGCRRTRRSTMGEVALRGRHLIKARCDTQAVIALSSAEAELYGAVRAGAEAIGLASMMNDLGVGVKGHILVDASATLGVIKRKGLGKLRDIQCLYLWIQEKNASNELTYTKANGTDNGADLLTKARAADKTLKYNAITDGQFMFTSDHRSLPIHYVGGSHDSEKLIGEICCLEFDIDGDAKAWTRNDLGSRTLRTTARGGRIGIEFLPAEP